MVDMPGPPVTYLTPEHAVPFRDFDPIRGESERSLPKGEQPGQVVRFMALKRPSYRLDRGQQNNRS
jgi:hypothetical protein